MYVYRTEFDQSQSGSFGPITRGQTNIRHLRNSLWFCFRNTPDCLILNRI